MVDNILQYFTILGRTKVEKLLLKYGASPMDENEKLNLEMVCSIFKLVRAYYGKLRQMRKMMDGKKVEQRLMAVLVVQA